MQIITKSQRLILIGLIVCLWFPSPATSEIHYVSVLELSYSPANLVIDEGDTVIWQWQDDMHDVLAGTPQNPAPHIMDSGILGVGAEYEVTFDRYMLQKHPVPDNEYDYFCTPHWSHGMIGQIKVNRPDKPFSAEANGAQAGTSSDSVAACELIMNGEETTLNISCSHNVSGVTSAEIRIAAFGEDGPPLCSISPQDLLDGITCNLTSGEADHLWDGNFYITINSGNFPGGELRGQFFHTDGSAAVTGRVQLKGGHPVSEVLVGNGQTSAKTNLSGLFNLQSANGVHTLTAQRSGFNISAADGTNPVFVNNSPVAARDFIAEFTNGSDCQLTDLSTQLADLKNSYTRLRNITRRSLRQFRNRTGKRRRANRLINRTNEEFDSIMTKLNQHFPYNSAIVTCNLCQEIDNSSTYVSYRAQARRWRRVTVRHGRLAAAAGLPELRRSRQQRRATRQFRSVRRTVNSLPVHTYRC